MKEYLYFSDKHGWRKWLEQNHITQDEAWLVRYMKHTGKTCITYKDAVDEALCFGWIDRILRDIDKERMVQKFSLRKQDRYRSKDNKKSAKNMNEKGRMTEDGLEKFKQTGESGERYAGVTTRSNDIPYDLQTALAANRQAEDCFRRFPALRQKQLIWRITHSNSSQMRRDPIKETVRIAEQNKYKSDKSDDDEVNLKNRMKHKPIKKKNYRELS